MKNKTFEGNTVQECLEKFNVWYRNDAKKTLPESSYKLIAVGTTRFHGYDDNGKEKHSLMATWPK